MDGLPDYRVNGGGYFGHGPGYSYTKFYQRLYGFRTNEVLFKLHDYAGNPGGLDEYGLFFHPIPMGTLIQREPPPGHEYRQTGNYDGVFRLCIDWFGDDRFGVTSGCVDRFEGNHGGYYGVRFYSADGPHYGWLWISESGGITAGGYERIPNQPLVAGTITPPHETPPIDFRLQMRLENGKAIFNLSPQQREVTIQRTFSLVKPTWNTLGVFLNTNAAVISAADGSGYFRAVAKP
jgi:hypothetical protein